MNILLCPDSFKESLSAQVAADAMALGARQALPQVECDLCPLADGGEGSLDALTASTGLRLLTSQVRGPLGHALSARWGWRDEEALAVIELAEVCGLSRVAPAKRDPLRASTFGLGQLLLEALDRGARRVLLLLGGSATNDGGAGMLNALGATLLDQHARPLAPGGGALELLDQLDLSGLDPRLAKLDIDMAVDVDNPLTGVNGASAVFGPQKGATPEQVKRLDKGLTRLADLASTLLSVDHRHTPGAGAAGGVGFLGLSFLQARCAPGIDIIMERAGMAARLDWADLVITGEGQLDGQSLAGKTPIGVARAAHAAGKPTVVIAGCLGEGWQACHQAGVTAAFALADGPLSLEQAMARSAELMTDRCESVVRLFALARSRH